MNKGDLVLVNYIGRNSDGEIFDLTLEDRAKEEGIYRDDVNYNPIPVLVGENYVIEGLDEALQDMEVGDEKEIDIPQEKAYGERDSDNIETYPEKEFQRQDINPRPGEELMIGNRRGKVLTNNSGRVRIDFNHPLSGQDLEYEVEIVEKVEDDEEKAGKIFQHVIGHGDYEVEDGVVKVEKVHTHDSHSHEIPEEMRDRFQEQVEEYTDLEVEFTE